MEGQDPAGDQQSSMHLDDCTDDCTVIVRWLSKDCSGVQKSAPGPEEECCSSSGPFQELQLEPLLLPQLLLLDKGTCTGKLLEVLLPPGRKSHGQILVSNNSSILDKTRDISWKKKNLWYSYLQIISATHPYTENIVLMWAWFGIWTNLLASSPFCHWCPPGAIYNSGKNPKISLALLIR